MKTAVEIAEEVLATPDEWEAEVITLARGVRTLNARTSEQKERNGRLHRQLEVLADFISEMLRRPYLSLGYDERFLHDHIPLTTRQKVLSWVGEEVLHKEE